MPLKRYCLVVFLLLTGCQTLKGQALIALLFGKKITNDRLKLGIILGASSSWMEVSGERPRIGFAIGAYTSYDFNDKWQGVMDIIMKSPKGAREIRYENTFITPDDPQLVGTEINRNVTYLTVAPLIRYKFTPSFGLAIGPHLGARVTAKDTYEKGMDQGSLSYKYNSKDQYHLADVGGTFDIQYVLMKGKGLRLNAQFNLGFINVYKNSDRSAYNRQVLVAVGIPIGGGSGKSNKK
ncbi:outer membrane beta-barrel protein [Chitinophaga arvensicola]|uniref:Outer membrane protein beta-barrel domain-containing protein n=1 Tax=Chitinophaga arvensicola TaxID=29529 RepID=A0A1I0RQK2_9BACT|nr:outer membrane beta-barrel protein [Chitinophaga arvensicola]SEW43605.1 Outer membrane protein beta-barrel domain-containing protein [Chitinophaga arvensicola]